jgi:hypothetical protein
MACALRWKEKRKYGGNGAGGGHHQHCHVITSRKIQYISRQHRPERSPDRVPEADRAVNQPVCLQPEQRSDKRGLGGADASLRKTYNNVV